MSGRILIVGAGLAGGRACETLRQEGYDGSIVLVGEEPDRPYERPPLSKEVLRSQTPAESSFLRDESWYADHDVELRLHSRSESLDPSFDACLISTGGRVRTLDAPGAELAGVHYLRTIRQATQLAELLQRKPRVVVVGAGFIGAEVAASARTLGCEVTMIEILEVPLQRVLGDEIGGLYGKIHVDHGVDLRLDEGVERIEGGDRVEAVVGSSGQTYPADVVIVGVGIVPNVELAQAAGIACDNGILVDDRCRTSIPDVFAAGDVANRPDPFSGGRIRVEHFQNAQNQGAAAARNMLGRDEPFEEVPWFWSDQYDVNLQMLGHFTPSPDMVVRGSLDERDFIALHVEADRVTGAIAMNRGKDISATRRLIERRVKIDPRLLADAEVPLRDLLRS